MADIEAIFLLVLFFFFGLGLLYYSYVTFKHYQLIRDTPTSKIRSAPVGITEVKGEVVPVEDVKDSDTMYTFSHPIRDDSVVYYHMKIQEHNPDDDGSDWDTVEENEVGEQFFVDDGTGQIAVDIDNPRFEFDDENKIKEKYILEPDSDPPAVLEEYTEDTFLPDFFDREKYRVIVKSIYPGEDVFVFGNAEIKDASSSKTNQENLIIRNPGDKDSKGTFDRGIPQIISTISEEELQSEFKWKTPAAFFGGLLLSTGCLYFLVTTLG